MAPLSNADESSQDSCLELLTLVIDTQTRRLLAINAAAAKIFGIRPGDNLSILRDFFPELGNDDWFSLFDQNDKQLSLSTIIRECDGSKQQVTLAVRPLVGIQGRQLLLSLEPLPANSLLILNRDALTGLPDRRELVCHYQRWQQAPTGQPSPCAVLFMDLDQFKQVNDQFGHIVGDEVLVALSSRWQNCVRDDDLIARYGGDEFVALIANINNRAEIAPVLARLSAVTQEPVVVGNEQVSLSVSIGVALSSQNSNHLEQLIHAADQDMYAVKRPG